jgi:hypothetical protein
MLYIVYNSLLSAFKKWRDYISEKVISYTRRQLIDGRLHTGIKKRDW